MDIRVTDNNIDYGIGTYKISLEDFGCKELHPFIITNKWDKVYIDLNDNTPRGIIRQLVPLASIRPVFDKNNITSRVMQLLCEIYPDEASKLRAFYIKDKKAFRELVEKLVQYD